MSVRKQGRGARGVAKVVGTVRGNWERIARAWSDIFITSRSRTARVRGMGGRQRTSIFMEKKRELTKEREKAQSSGKS